MPPAATGGRKADANDLLSLSPAALFARVAARPDLFFGGKPGDALSEALRAALKSLADEGA